MTFGAPATRNPASRSTCCLTRSGFGMPFRTTDSGCSPRSAISREPRSNHRFSSSRLTVTERIWPSGISRICTAQSPEARRIRCELIW